MAANNETGLIQPIQEIAQVVRAAGAAFHTDAVQAIGLIDIDFSGLDAMTISGHKIGAPVGVGALIARRDFPLEALEGGALLGTANLVDLDWKNRHATHGVMLGDPAMRGRRVGEVFQSKPLDYV